MITGQHRLRGKGRCPVHATDERLQSNARNQRKNYQTVSHDHDGAVGRCGSRASVILAAQNPWSRIVPSMLFVGFVVAALGAWMMTVATKQLSRVNEGHRLPMIIGRFAVRPPFAATALRVGAQTAALLATLIVLNATWNYTAPWPSTIAAATTLIAPVAIPVIAITLAHNRRLPAPGR